MGRIIPADQIVENPSVKKGRVIPASAVVAEAPPVKAGSPDLLQAGKKVQGPQDPFADRVPLLPEARSKEPLLTQLGRMFGEAVVPGGHAIKASVETGGGPFADLARANDPGLTLPPGTPGSRDPKSRDEIQSTPEQNKAYSKKRDEEYEKLDEARADSPVLGTASQVAGFLLPGPTNPVPGVGAARLLPRIATNTARQTARVAEETYGRGGDVAKEGGKAATVAALTSLIPLGSTFGQQLASGLGSAVVGERTGRVLEEGRLGAALEKPEEMMTPASAAAFFAAAAAGGRGVRRALRNPNTRRGQAIQEVEDVGGKIQTVGETIKLPKGVERGPNPLGTATKEAAQATLMDHEFDKPQLYKMFRDAESKRLSEPSARKPIKGVRSKIVAKIDEKLATVTADDGEPIPGADKTLKKWRDFFEPPAKGVTLETEDGGTVRGTMKRPPRKITLNDLVKYRRRFDEKGKGAKPINKRYRELAGMMREIIDDVDETLGGIYKKESEMLDRQASRNEKIGGARKPEIKPTVKNVEKVAGRLGATRDDDQRAVARDEALDEAAASSPELAKRLPEIRALKAKKYLTSQQQTADVSRAYGSKVRMGREGLGFLMQNSLRLDPAIAAAQEYTALPSALMFNLTAPGKKKKEDQK